MRDRDRDDRHFERSDRTERYGGGQSGYGAGRFGDDRSMGPGYRNQSRPQGRYDDRQGMHTDDRFTGRGGEGYWEDRTERTGYGGDPGGAQFANEYNQGRYPDMDGPNEQYGQQAYGPRGGPNTHWGQGEQSVSHRGKGPVGYTRSDDRIREAVCETLSDDDHIDASHIEVVVKNGEVLLTGLVEDRRQKRLAEDIIERLPGVKDVQNQLRIASERHQAARGNPNGNQAVGRTETETSSDKKHRA